VTFAALFMTNSWDVITFGLVWFAAAVMAFRRTGWNWTRALFNGGQYLILPVGVALLIAAPFIVNLESPSMSLGLVSSEASDPWSWLRIWLVPLLPPLAAAVGLRVAGHWRHAVMGIGVVLAAIALWELIQISTGNADALSERGSGWVMLLLLAAVIGAGVASMVRAEGELDKARSAWLGLVSLALVIMLGTELVNIETGTAGRFNTVFKLWYHLWTLIALAGAVAFAQTELDPTEDVLLQAVTNAYEAGGILAAASGVPTVLNWAAHEVQWRGPDAPLAGRATGSMRRAPCG